MYSASNHATQGRASEALPRTDASPFSVTSDSLPHRELPAQTEQNEQRQCMGRAAGALARSLSGYDGRALFALPLVASALCLSLYSRLDLLLLKLLGATASGAGIYGVAQNLALLPSLFSFAFAPALLSTLSALLLWAQVANAAGFCYEKYQVRRVGSRFNVGL
jgi:hypothetical protein